jgi:hypothetical protein
MWILLDAVDYYSVETLLVQRGIEYINPYLNQFAIPTNPRNQRIAMFLVLRGLCSIEESVGLDRILQNFTTDHPKRIVKMT